MVKPVKIFLSSTLITMQNYLVALCHTVREHVGDAKRCAGAGPQFVEIEIVSDPGEHAPGHSTTRVTIPSLVGLRQTVLA